MPFWAVVTEDTHHNAAPGAFILGSNDNANVLGCGLRKIHEAMQGKWDPDWCIDKDEKEFKSIKDVNKDIFTGEVSNCSTPCDHIHSRAYRYFCVIFMLRVPGVRRCYKE